jgi:hypothetical protein
MLLMPLLSASEVTYRDIEPIVAKHCAGCHQKGEIGPMPLTTYREVRPWAKAMREAVIRRSMPPWHADAETSKHFRNDRSLTDSERDKFVAWVDAGAREGGSGEAKPVPVKTLMTRDEGWRLGKPDLIVRVPGFKVPARGTLEYTFLVSPTSFPSDQWIAAAEWKIDKRAVVHHINAFIRPPGSSYVKTAPVGQLYVASKEERAARRNDEREVERRELLVGYEPGYRAQPWGEGRAKLLPRGGDVVLEMHYNPNGEAVVDYSELGIYFAKSTPKERVLTISPADSKFEIPAGDGAYQSVTGATFKEDVTLVSLQPHMHLRGKSYEIAVKYPEGRRDVVLRVPKYDFRWQTTYFLKEPLRLPKGAQLECIAVFDNSVNNPFNPDPKQVVRWGDQSWEEMNIGFTEVAIPIKQDAEVAELHGTTRAGSAGANR